MLEICGTQYPDGWVKAKLGSTALFYRLVGTDLRFFCTTKEWGLEPVRQILERVCRYNQWEVSGYTNLQENSNTIDQWLVDRVIPVRVGFWRNLAQTLHMVPVLTKKVRGTLMVEHQSGLPTDVTNPTYVQSMTEGNIQIIVEVWK